MFKLCLLILYLRFGFFFFFFFQAEDGIRDHCVTGVQTCALPICRWRRQARGCIPNSFTSCRMSLGSTSICAMLARSSFLLWSTFMSGRGSRQSLCRSEERREGKSVDLGGRWIIKKIKK